MFYLKKNNNKSGDNLFMKHSRIFSEFIEQVARDCKTHIIIIFNKKLCLCIIVQRSLICKNKFVSKRLVTLNPVLICFGSVLLF